MPSIATLPTRRRLGLAVALLLAASGAAAAAEDAIAAPRPAEAQAWMDEAYRLKALGDGAGAALALESARTAGYDPQRVALELAYVAADRGETARMRGQLELASRGPDAGLAAQARAELRALGPSRSWRWDLYGEAFSWWRLRGPEETADAVPTLRLRALHRPWAGLPLELYAVAQATRDVASRPATAVAGPVILADNSLLLGAGLLLRPWHGLGLFAQAAGATPLADDGRPSLALDLRGGAYLGLESERCAPSAAGARLVLLPCAELYAEAVWLGRFRDDVVGLARGRAGASWLLTGPVAWQLVAEVRGAADSNRDWYDNLADVGIGHRWRLARPARADLLLSAHLGRFWDRGGSDPAPARLTFTDLRLEIALDLEP